MPKWTTAADIDSAVQERRYEEIARLVDDADLPTEVRNHLALTVAGLLEGSMKPPRRRPPKRGLSCEQEDIGQRVWRLKRDKGWQKISAAVAHVAETLKISPSTVWSCWRKFDVVRYELRREKVEFDAWMDAANEGEQLMREEALEWLSDQGNDTPTEEDVDAVVDAWCHQMMQDYEAARDDDCK